MNISDSDISQAGLIDRLPALCGIAAGGDRHIPEIKMRVKPEQNIGNVRLEAGNKFSNLEDFLLIDITRNKKLVEAIPAGHPFLVTRRRRRKVERLSRNLMSSLDVGFGRLEIFKDAFAADA
jgi:hypothetical protein